MLTKRQYSIFNYFTANSGHFISSKELSNNFLISIRTIKSELKIVKDFCDHFDSFIVETMPGSGSRIIIHDHEKFKHDCSQIHRSANSLLNTSNEGRMMAILKMLFNANGYTSKYTLLETLYISESTLYHTLNDIKKIISPYHLVLVHKTNLGFSIEGSEVDKRMCIGKNDLFDEMYNPYAKNKNISEIYNDVANVFIQYKYQINEVTLQNITAHILLIIDRVKNGHLLSGSLQQELSDCKEYQISSEILNKYLFIYNVQPSQLHHEVYLLTQTILGKLQYNHDEHLHKEINDFINDSFSLIRNKFYVNFEPLENLKLLLSLHLVPLFYRVKSGTQLVNAMTMEIQQTFPLAHDIAIYFSILIKEHFHMVVSQDEISYFSLYFNYGLENYQLGNSAKHIMIITSLRKAETVLLRHKILTWFPNQIAEISFIEDTQDFEPELYDAVFSTDKDIDKYKGGITSINIFPDEKDFEKINLAINGYTDINAILEKFSKDCYFYGKVKNKDELLHIVCENAKSKYQLPSEFESLIKERETITSTYFGNGIAIPHPLTPFSNETFASIGILEKPIKWDDSHHVQLVILVSIEKNNPKAFQFWYYLSSLIRSEELFPLLTKQPTFDAFIQVLQRSLKDEFQDK